VTYRPEGEGTMSPTYAQQHRPVGEQEKAVGHAVRAGYLYAGMADVSALTGDMRYARAAERIWHDVVDTKMHLIGGLGATHGIEGFGPPYDLPNRDTYNETCAAVANVFFNFRMYLMHRDATYFDVAEVALLNNALAGISLKGDSFFYVNVLEADGIKKFNHGSGGRSPWFGCACCPSNLARLMPQVSGYMYTHTTDEVYLGLYGSSQTQIALDAGKVSINQVTDYPFDGHIALEVEPDQPHDFTLQLRIPTWVRERFVPGALYHYIDDVKPAWTVKVNGKRVKTDVNKGFAAVRRTWKRGDRVELDLPMPVRFSAALDHVKANRGRLAVTRGPLVYCAEQADNGNAKIQRFFMPKPCDSGRIQQTTIRQGPLKGITKISLPGQEVIENSSRTTKVNMIPYYAWNNRGEDSMIIWMPRTRDMAAASMVSNLLTQSDLGEVRVTHTKAGDSIAAVVDGAVPNSSADQRGPRWTSLPFKNNRQDITISFPETRRVTRVLVYWYQDPGKGEVRLPRDWWIDTRLCRKSPPSARERAIFSSGNDGEAGDIGVIVDAAGSSQGEKGPLEARASFPTEPKSDHDDWKRMKKYVTDFYGLEPNQFNMVRPDAPLTCNRLRISVLPQQGYCMGIHEIQVEFE
ncbi:MAG: glycoside hydrolase family 127 protein, partial [Phycisphaeraceae bacterium]|nr:glycoside hydrolase family 127 protein [Phycisphaeraceae bacterium]